jgi:hypothetical protein
MRCSFGFLQHRHQVSSAPFSEPIQRYVRNKTPSPRQDGGVFDRAELAPQHSLKAKLANPLELNLTGRRHLHNRAQVRASGAETDHDGFLDPCQSCDLALESFKTESFSFNLHHAIYSPFEAKAAVGRERNPVRLFAPSFVCGVR